MKLYSPLGFEVVPQHLKDRFPYMFFCEDVNRAKQRFSKSESKESNVCSIPTSWEPIFEKLCADIDALLGDDKHGFYWTKISDRLDWTMDDFVERVSSLAYAGFILSHGPFVEVPWTMPSALQYAIDSLVRSALIKNKVVRGAK